MNEQLSNNKHQERIMRWIHVFAWVFLGLFITNVVLGILNFFNSQFIKFSGLEKVFKQNPFTLSSTLAQFLFSLALVVVGFLILKAIPILFNWVKGFKNRNQNEGESPQSEPAFRFFDPDMVSAFLVFINKMRLILLSLPVLVGLPSLIKLFDTLWSFFQYSPDAKLGVTVAILIMAIIIFAIEILIAHLLLNGFETLLQTLARKAGNVTQGSEDAGQALNAEEPFYTKRHARLESFAGAAKTVASVLLVITVLLTATHALSFFDSFFASLGMPEFGMKLYFGEPLVNLQGVAILIYNLVFGLTLVKVLRAVSCATAMTLEADLNSRLKADDLAAGEESTEPEFFQPRQVMQLDQRLKGWALAIAVAFTLKSVAAIPSVMKLVQYALNNAASSMLVWGIAILWTLLSTAVTLLWLVGAMHGLRLVLKMLLEVEHQSRPAPAQQEALPEQVG